MANCTKSACKCKNRNFFWRDKSKVYVYNRKRIIFFLTLEQLKWIATPCGFCNKQEIEKLYQEIKNHQRG